VIKAYAKAEHARRALAGACEARRIFGPGGALTVATPLGQPRENVVVFEHEAGIPLRDLASAEAPLAPWRAAGAWLATLHAAPAARALPLKTIGHELEKATRWSAQLCEALPARDAAGVRRVLAAWLARRTLLEASFEPAPIHRDYHPGNLLWDGTRLCAVDLDALSAGDRALDVAYFEAQVAKLANARAGALGGLAALTAAFRSGYERALAPPPTAARRFFSFYSFVYLGALEVERHEPGWLERARMFAEAATRGNTEMPSKNAVVLPAKWDQKNSPSR
jgi:aminoglycoside phosphotransferase (APT) family kinase protein